MLFNNIINDPDFKLHMRRGVNTWLYEHKCVEYISGDNIRCALCCDDYCAYKACTICKKPICDMCVLLAHSEEELKGKIINGKYTEEYAKRNDIDAIAKEYQEYIKSESDNYQEDIKSESYEILDTLMPRIGTKRYCYACYYKCNGKVLAIHEPIIDEIEKEFPEEFTKIKQVVRFYDFPEHDYV